MKASPIVLKFGGTSVQNADAMQRVAGIVKNYPAGRTVVVTSALSGITNALLNVVEYLRQRDGEAVKQEIETIRNRHKEIVESLPLSEEDFDLFSRQLDTRLTEFSETVRDAVLETGNEARKRDEIASYGELLSSIALTAALKSVGIPAVWFDARDVMLTDDTHGAATPLQHELEQEAHRHLTPLLQQRMIPVTQGFIGRCSDGTTTTLGRGGSDYTAALLGAALDADRIEIWTDVSGIMTTDPRIVPGAAKVHQLTFAEAAELAYFGAKVLHPATLLPAMKRDIPVIVRNTNAPEDAGTTITRNGDENNSRPVKAIAFKRGITVINVTSTRMLMAYGFLHRVFEIFDRYRTPVDLVATSEVSISITIDDTRNLEEMRTALAEIGTVEIHHDLAIVCLVSSGLRHTPGMAAQVFDAVRPTNVRMISQGASELNLSFVIDEIDLADVVKRLHAGFFERIDVAV